MSRSAWKIPYMGLNFLTDRAVKKTARNANTNSRRCLVFERASTIVPSFIGKTLEIHNGHKFVPITITENSVGFKFGQFALTKKRVHHKKKK